MSQALITRLRKQREFKKAVGKFTFICRRPTDQEAGQLFNSTMCGIAQRFVVGWEDVIEDDVVGGGGSDSLEFDAGLWQEWCADRKDFWAPCAAHVVKPIADGEKCPHCAPLSNAILDAYTTHREGMETAAKNSLPGSSNAT